MEGNTLFGDLMEALYEVEEYQKGNIELKTRTVTMPDHDICLRHNNCLMIKCHRI